MSKYQKEYILSLVGSGYHSCVMTTFSFDFHYFDRSVMRSLRSKGISNISVLIDNNIFQGILGNIKIGSNSRTYSISPIKTTGSFHPKLYIFFGEKQCLLVVGSGNLTSSGHGKNDEIWGVFHFDENNTINAQLISNAWDYLSQISGKIKGFTNEKFRWVIEYSPWIEKLPTPNQDLFQKLDEKNEIVFLSNKNEASIYNRLINLLPVDEIIKITIVAPYFDTKGRALENFFNDFRNAKINTLVDEANGILPLELKEDVADNINFFRWSDCYIDKSIVEKNSRLHAKFIHFETKKGEQYCLFGSANISIAGLGGKNYNATNEEAAILIKSTNQDFLPNLGVKPKFKNKLSFSELKDGIDSDKIIQDNESSNLNYSIEAIDKEGVNLIVYINLNPEKNIGLAVYNSWGELITILQIKLINRRYISICPTDIEEPVYACLVEETSFKVVSNKQIIQDVFVLSKANPDPQKQILDVLFSGIEQGDELLFSKLIDCISPNSFVSENPIQAKKGISGELSENKSENQNESGEKLSYEDFKNVSYNNLQHQYSVLNSNSNRIAEFLTYFSHLKTTDEISSQESDDEEIDVDIDNIQGRDDVQIKTTITQSSFHTEKRRIISFLKRYDTFISKQIDDLLEHSNKNIANSGLVTITDLSNFIISLYIAIYYTDKKREFEKDGITHHEKIISSYGFDDLNNLPVINTDLIGQFLLLCTRGFVIYESDYLNERMSKLKKEALYHCLYCIESANWGKDIIEYKNILLINTLYYLDSDLEILLEKENLVNELNLRLKLASIDTQNLIVDLTNQIIEIKPKYVKFKRNLELPINKRKTHDSKELWNNSIVFTSRFGFCSIATKTNEKEGAYLTLSRPGFPWIDKKEEYLLEEKRLYKRNLVF